MAKRIEIKTAYLDYEGTHRDIIIQARDGETYLMDKDEVKKIMKVM